MKHVSSHKDRHGKIRYRFRKTGCKPCYIHGEPGTPEFAAQVEAAKLVPYDAAKEERRYSEALKVARSIENQAVIYFVGAAVGPIKIGFTTDLTSRLKKLQVASPKALRLLAVMPGTMADEAALHKQFADSRVRGEWFARTPALTKLLHRLANR